MNWKRLGCILALTLSISALGRPAWAYCWEVGLKVNNCGSKPIKIYNTATGALVFSGASRTACSNGANFFIDLNANCPTSSSEVSLQTGTTYLFEINWGTDYKKALFVGGACPVGSTCDSVFSATSSSLTWTSGTDVHSFSGYPNVVMLGATLEITSSQQIGSSMQYDLKATATPNVGPFNFSWSNATRLTGASVNPSTARATVSTAKTVSVTLTSNATSEVETIVRSLPLAPPAGRKGMTWKKTGHDAIWGVDYVGCPDCEPYGGDTLCSTSLPILCIKTDGSPNPGVIEDGYRGWIGGNIALTPSIRGDQIGSLANADALCANAHGSGWKMAEFHHPTGGWNWASRGDVADGSRFWLYIYDQSANCWN